MARLITKAARLEVRELNFNSLKSTGYTQETYKDYDFFTKDANGRFYLQIFKGSASGPFHNFYHSTDEARAKYIVRSKQNADAAAERKAAAKGQKRTLTGAAGCAAEIRIELKKCFPDVKFSVTSECFSGGDAVRIGWENGPTDDMVRDITRKYQSGHFNSMEDMYEYSNNRNDLQQAKYITTSRKVTDDVNAVVIAAVQTIFSCEAYGHWEAGQIAYRILSKNIIPVGAVVTGLKENGKNGQFEDCYNLTFENYEAQPESLSKVAALIADNETANFEKVETVTGEVNIIQYSEKAIAVIGDTKPIKDALKALGGKFNFRLTCGAGWIFSNNKLQAVTDLLSGAAAPEPTKETFAAAITNKVPIVAEIVPETTLKDEVSLMINALASFDISNDGEISESVKEAARVQGVIIGAVPEVQTYNSVADIENAANSGKVISLLNYSNLLNNKVGKA